MHESRRKRLETFVIWCDQNIDGDEKGEAQIFLDRFFQAFGHDGLFEAGGKAEFRIRKAKEDGGGTAFADCVWKPHVLIEMKKSGEYLGKHFRQAFDYWTRLVPGRPHYVVLCNFDEFWVYDFDTQIDTPVDKIKLADLPDRYGPLQFLFPTHEEPIFGNDHEQVTRVAAARLGTLFRKLRVREDVGRETAQRFVLQLLVALFAEDIGLLEQFTINRLVNACHTPEDGYEIFCGLFAAMNDPAERRGGRFKSVDYFNGGIFADPARINLHPDELKVIEGAASEDWSKVRPEIFGTIFEQTMSDGSDGGQDERHAYGAHFTYATDIYKILRPTIIDPWEALIDDATTIKRLRELHQRMQAYRVLDPACGSGNFLYLAYREIKRLEKKLLDKLSEISKRQSGEQMQFSFVTTKQFFGMDINPFAVELAKVTMMLAHKLAIDELHIDEPALPLDNLDDNFRCVDALIVPQDSPLALDEGEEPKAYKGQVQTAWPAADVIIGNPPFLGAKRLKPERGADYANAVRKLYPDVPGMADYCVYWFRRSHDHLPMCTPEDPVAGRAGLVGTQNIRNNKSREGGLDHITATGTVIEAVDNQPWSGEANVHVSIANWVKHPANEKKPERLLIPADKKLWVKVDPPPGGKKKRRKGQGPAHKEYELAIQTTADISSALSDAPPVDRAKPLESVKSNPCSFQGVKLGYSGFQLSNHERRRFIQTDSEYSKVVKPWLRGSDLVRRNGQPSKSVIDFGSMELMDAMSFDLPFEALKEKVMPSVVAKAKKAAGKSMEAARLEHLDRWWQFWNVRHEMRDQLQGVTRYIACSQVTKRPIFCFVSDRILPDATLQIWSLDDDYSFAVIQSGIHWSWFLAKCSKLTERLRYTRRSVWDTFPWPQGEGFGGPTDSQVDAVAAAGREVRRVRAEALKKIKGGLRAVYRTLELPGKNPLKDAHAALDAAVMAAYGFSAKKDLLKQLLDLNFAVAEREKAGEPVVAPGIPPSYSGDRAALVTEDCISP